MSEPQSERRDLQIMVKLVWQKASEAARLRSRRWVTHGPWSSKLLQAFAPEFPIIEQQTLLSMGYSSQLGQDLLLDRFLFHGMREGIFLDIGAHDGRTFSNSFFLESERGWSGVCVEPNPNVFPALLKNRRCVCIQAAVTDDPSPTVEFLAPGSPDLSMLAGLRTAYGRRHLRRLKHESLAADSEVATIEVPSVSLASLTKECGLTHVDVLMIDVEGAELRVLASADWRTFRPSAILLESNYGSSAPVDFLRGRGYQLLARIGWDRIFVRSDVAAKAVPSG